MTSSARALSTHDDEPGLYGKRLEVWNLIVSKCNEPDAAYLGSSWVANRLAQHDAAWVSSDVGHRILRCGVAGTVLEPLAELLEVGPTQLAPVLGIDRTTARRYAREDHALPQHSAEAVLRLAELEALALDVFATEHGAHQWLKTEHPMLGESPIAAASTSYGAQRVREILTAIRYGGVV